MPTGFPLPVVDDLNRPFHEAAQRHELVFQRCRACSTWSSLPVLACSGCQGVDLVWTAVSGHGHVHTYVVPRKPSAAVPQADLVVAVVQLDEGPRYLTRLLGVSPEQVRFDLPVRVVFETVADGLVLPLFRPAPAAVEVA